MKQLGLALVIGLAAVAAQAEDHFFQASLTPEIALRARTDTITGISLNIWGENPQKSFTLGFVNGSTGDSKGFSWGLWNYSENYTGVHWGVVNTSTGKFIGWQNAMVNWSKDVEGLQTGWVNYTEKLNGVQLGLVCIVKDNPWFKEFPDKLAMGFPFLNWSF